MNIQLCMRSICVVIGIGLITADVGAQFTSTSTGADGALEYFSPPSARRSNALVYDENRDRTVLFGGTLDGDETWEWDGSNWTRILTATNPVALSDHAMVYDSTRNVIVLFGGSDGDETNATWEYDGTNWTEIATATSPGVRVQHAMAYDRTRNVVVMFGGENNGVELNDTWEYDGTNWSLKIPASSPVVRDEHVMGYDVGGDQVIMYGGSDGSTEYGDTWSWDGTNWTLLSASDSIGKRAKAAMTYDPVEQRLLVFGGFDDVNSRRADTWEWRNGTWSRLYPDTTPALREEHGFAYGPNQQVVLCGGAVQQSNGSFTEDNVTSLFGDVQGVVDWRVSATGQANMIFDMSARSSGVWNYTSISIAEGVTVTFSPNAANTPVSWLASGDVTIDGTLDISGANAGSNVAPGNEAAPGPGGFAGGLGGTAQDISGTFSGTAGAGPGGGGPGVSSGEGGGDAGYQTAGNSTHGGAAYGSRLLVPLTGGSGGGGGASTSNTNGGNGGGGGGAILIAADGTITVDGSILSNGGSPNFTGGDGGYGSGGGIRLAANTLAGTGQLKALGANGSSHGFIRLEAYSNSFTPSFIFPTPSVVPPIGIQPIQVGTITVTNVAGQPVPEPPAGNPTRPDIVFASPGDITISFSTTNIPQGTVIDVTVSASGQLVSTQSTAVDGGGNATATLTVPAGVGTISATATY